MLHFKPHILQVTVIQIIPDLINNSHFNFIKSDGMLSSDQGVQKMVIFEEKNEFQVYDVDIH